MLGEKKNNCTILSNSQFILGICYYTLNGWPYNHENFIFFEIQTEVKLNLRPINMNGNPFPLSAKVGGLSLFTVNSIIQFLEYKALRLHLLDFKIY